MKKIYKNHPGRVPLYEKGVVLFDLKKKNTCESEEYLKGLASRERMAIEREEKVEWMLIGLQSIIEQIKHSGLDIQIPSEIVDSPLSTREPPPDTGSAPRMDRARSWTSTRNPRKVSFIYKTVIQFVMLFSEVKIEFLLLYCLLNAFSFLRSILKYS